MSPRDNGLRAESYTVLVEIEESLGERMLGALAERRIAAYVLPARGPGGTTRLILHVDARLRVPAGIVLAGLAPAPAGELPSETEAAAEAPGSPPVDGLADDAAFAEIVAGFYQTPPERSWPAAEDLPPDPPPAAARSEAGAPAGARPYTGADRRRPLPSPQPPAASSPRPADDDEHYAPPHLPRLSPFPSAVRWALFALGVGLALLLVPTVLAFDHGTSLDVAGVGCILLGTAMLLVRLRERSPDDPDDGAVV